MRLDRFVSHSSGLTRREAQIVIRRGLVTVDGAVIKDAGFHVADTASVAINDEDIEVPRKRYFMLHKPEGYVCATEDRTHLTVLSLLNVPHPERLHVAGRLDIDTTGLILITDDGEWSHRVTAPRFQCEKMYRVQLASPIEQTQIESLAAGVELHGEPKPCRPAQVEVVNEREILLSISEGKYHQVKRMLAAVGNHVTRLHREKIGSIFLDAELASGDWRELTQQEIESF